MKNLLTALLWFCYSVSGISQITEAEYYINSDNLAVGNQNTLAVTTGNTIDENFSIPTTGLPEGLHTLHIRAKGTNNIWSLYKRAYFYIQTPNTTGTPQPIVSAEYYIDTDNLGVGNQTALAITSGMTINESFSISTIGLPQGLHVLHIRVKDANNTWSLYKRTYFYTHSPNSNAIATPIITAEYFFDTDPGVGNATLIAVTQGFNIDEDLLISVPLTMTNGDHYLYIRVQNQDGIWSLYKRALFTADDSLSVEAFYANSFEIYPNPTKDIVYINFKKNGAYSFILYNISGEEIFEQKVLELHISINLSNYASGIYILKMKNEKDNTFQNIKIVKQ